MTILDLDLTQGLPHLLQIDGLENFTLYRYYFQFRFSDQQRGLLNDYSQSGSFRTFQTPGVP